MNITFGSNNYKSAGAGDRGKTTGAAEDAANASMSYGGAPASTGAMPAWLWYVVGGVALLALVGSLLIPGKKKKQ